uniref:RING-type domain-containing protein n=1 Tax=Alexandrium monilatum TaxID=311494 RepID=A0A7S4PXZ9_9DINO
MPKNSSTLRECQEVSSHRSRGSLGGLLKQVQLFATSKAELAQRKSLRSKVELAAKQKVEQLCGREHETQEPEDLIAAKRAVSSGVPLRPQRPSGECAICGEKIEAKHLKRLPCEHSFHFVCIDEFHRQKMRKEKDMSLPCYTCKAPSHRSINVLADERRARREAEAEAAARAAAQEEAARAEAAAAAGAAGRRTHSVTRRRGGALAALARAAQGGAAGSEEGGA